MKYKQTISKQLGISQKTIAELLMVSRTQYALYDSGKRDLPLKSKLQLNKMLLCMKQEKMYEEQEKNLHDNQVKMIQAFFKQEYTTSQHKQILIERKLIRMEKKYQSGVSALRLISFLETQTDDFDINSVQKLDLIRTKALQDMDKNGIHQQAKLQLKKEALQVFTKQLQEKLQNFEKFSK